MLCGMAKRYLQKASVGGDGNPFRGALKNSRNQVDREKHRPSLAMACQPRPSLALLYLPTESVDNPVHETW